MYVKVFDSFGYYVVISYEISVMGLVDDGIVNGEVVSLVFGMLFVEESFEVKFGFGIEIVIVECVVVGRKGKNDLSRLGFEIMGGFLGFDVFEKMDEVGEYDVVSKFRFGVDVIDLVILFRNGGKRNDEV